VEPSEWVLSQDEDGTRHAVGNPISLSVLPDGGSKVFMRNGVKGALGGPAREHTRWLIGELKGVRVYVVPGPDGVSIVMTTKDMYP